MKKRVENEKREDVFGGSVPVDRSNYKGSN